MMLLLVALFLIGWSRQRDGVAFMKMYGLFWTVGIFMTARSMNQFKPEIWTVAALVLVTCFCLRETALGYAQAFGLRTSNNLTYLCTGSFMNPGPMGGFLAVCACILLGYAVKGTKSWLKYFCLVVAAIVLPLIPATMSRAGMLALVSGLLFLGLSVEKLRSWIRRNILLLSCLGILLSGAGYLAKRGSADGRLLIARVSANAIVHGGVIGSGPGHFCGAYGQEQARFFSRKDRSDKVRQMADCPEYAFNEYLQAGVEAGPLALVLTVMIVLTVIIRQIQSGSFWAYGMIALSVFALFSYPASQWQFIPLTGILLGSGSSNGTGKKYLSGILAMTFIGIGLCMAPEQRARKHAEGIWKNCRRWYDNEQYEYVVDDYSGIAEKMDHNAEFLFQYGMALSKTGNYDTSDSVLRIGAGISSDPMFWNILGRNCQDRKDYVGAESIYRHAFQMAPNRLYPLYLLAKLYHENNDTALFLETARRALDFNPKIESSKTLLLRQEIESLLNPNPSINEK